MIKIRTANPDAEASVGITDIEVIWSETAAVTYPGDFQIIRIQRLE